MLLCFALLSSFSQRLKDSDTRHLNTLCLLKLKFFWCWPCAMTSSSNTPGPSLLMTVSVHIIYKGNPHAAPKPESLHAP